MIDTIGNDDETGAEETCCCGTDAVIVEGVVCDVVDISDIDDKGAAVKVGSCAVVSVATFILVSFDLL